MLSISNEVWSYSKLENMTSIEDFLHSKLIMQFLTKTAIATKKFGEIDLIRIVFLCISHLQHTLIFMVLLNIKTILNINLEY